MSTVNVEMGTCRSKWGAMAPFQTKGGVEVSYAPEYHEVVLDMYGKSPIDEILIGEVIKAKVPIAETTYNNLKAAIPAATEVTDAAGKSKLTIGRYPGWKLSQVAQPLVLHPLSYPDDQKEYDIVIHKAVPMGEIKFLYEFDKERIYEVTFVGLVDTDRTNGDFIGTIGDPTISADTVAPVLTVLPANNAVGVLKTADLAWTSTKPLNSDTVIAEHVMVYKDSDGSKVNGTLSYDPDTMTINFIPALQFAGTSKYIAVVTTGVKGANGVALAAPLVSNFTTGA